MNSKRFFRSMLGAMLLLCSSLAFAQATRTWVSGVGDDANPCSRTAPCKTFAGAISKTAAGGTIDVLDPGGFGAVTITKAITLENIGAVAGVLASGTNGIVVNAGANDTVVLRGLSIDGAGTTLGINGVRFLAGGKLVIENSTIQNFSSAGIDFEPSGASQLVVNNTTVNNMSTAGASGVLIAGSGTNLNAVLNNVRIVHNNAGLQVKNGNVSVRTSAFGQNSVGVKVVSSSALARVALDDSMVSDSVGAGLTVSGTGASAVISRSAITNNGIGIVGTVQSFGDNRIFNNGTDGSPSGSLTLH